VENVAFFLIILSTAGSILALKWYFSGGKKKR
jgi:hypothetical protein